MNRWSSPQIVRSIDGHGSRSTRKPPPPLGTDSALVVDHVGG